MTYDDDFVLIGMVQATLKSLDIEWPPPPFIEVNNHGELPNLLLKRVRYSEITDEQRAGMTHVARGAEYVPATSADLHFGSTGQH